MSEYKTVLDKATGELKRVAFDAPQMPPEEARIITEDDLAKLERYSREELITLIKRVSGAMWGIGLMTSEERREAKKLKISILALTSPDDHMMLKACNDWLDREEGKAIQRIDQRVLNVHKGIAGDMTNEELTAALRSIKQLPPGVTLLENGTLDVVSVDNISDQ